MGRIVVGVDGSDASPKALEWSAMVARASGTQIIAVSAACSTWVDP